MKNISVEQKAISVLATTIKEIVKAMIDKADYDVTVKGVVVYADNNGAYIVSINGDEYKIKSSLKLTKGQDVRVMIPKNRWDDMFILNALSDERLL